MNTPRLKSVIFAGITTGLAMLPQSSFALTIIRNFTGGAAPVNTAGGGDLVTLFNAAADLWQAAILDSHVVTVNFSWGAQTGSTLAAHSLLAQGGAPNRETAGSISFDNDGSSVWFMDATPFTNTEFATLTESFVNLGGGLLNSGRVYSGATGAAVGRIDLLSTAMHEIGHALGLSGANSSFIAGNADLDVDVTAPRPFPGSVIPTVSGAHLNISTALMFPSVSAGIRKDITAVDILANAQISQFTDLVLPPGIATTDGGSASLLLLTALAGIVGLRRKLAA